MQKIFTIPNFVFLSKTFIDFNRNGIFRSFSLISTIFNRKLKSTNVLSILGKRKCHSSAIAESRMKELLQNRSFISTSNVEPTDGDIQFTVCSYNILAQYQLTNNIYLYTHCETGVLEWPLRWKNIKNDLSKMNCDIYCLQEVQCDHYYNDIEPAMKDMGYNGFLSSKTGKKLDGCAMFVKTNKFNCDSSNFKTVNFHNPTIHSLATDNVGQIALLCPIDSPNSKICVANTHLFFNPNRGEIKLAEISLLLSKVDSIAKSGRDNDRSSSSFYWPIIFCGDLNSEPNSSICKFLVDGRFEFHDLLASDISGQNKTSFWGEKSSALLSKDELPPRVGISDDLVLDSAPTSLGSGVLTHLLRLRSVYTYSTKDKPRLVTAFTNADTCAVDFIFYRFLEDEKVSPHLELLSYMELLSSNDFFSFGGIPNKQHGSDHIPLVAKFILHV